jgi:hypothetical protein
VTTKLPFVVVNFASKVAGALACSAEGCKSAGGGAERITPTP